MFAERGIEFVEVTVESVLNVVGLTDIDPFTGVGDSINAGRPGRVLADGSRSKRAGKKTLKGHYVPIPFECISRGSGSLCERYSLGPVYRCPEAFEEFFPQAQLLRIGCEAGKSWIDELSPE